MSLLKGFLFDFLLLLSLSVRHIGFHEIAFAVVMKTIRFGLAGRVGK